jgi:hypothetical protein
MNIFYGFTNSSEKNQTAELVSRDLKPNPLLSVEEQESRKVANTCV